MSPNEIAINLVPWDPTSEAHVQRLRQQRLICGWGVDRVDEWRCQQLLKEKALHWIVLNPTIKNHAQFIREHTLHFPKEQEALKDAASERAFIPIGHISMDLIPSTALQDAPSTVPAQRRFYGSNFYISSALRGHAFARKSMEALIHIAANEPFYATEALAEIPTGRTVGDGGAKFSLPDWYEMLGWKRVKNEPTRCMVEVDAEGRELIVELMVFRCDIRGYRRVVEKAVL